MKIYLSGGSRGDWQDDLIRAITTNGVEFIDPRDWADEQDPQVYTAKDLAGVEAADLVIAFLDDGNPSGIGMALEVGYAKALGKSIVSFIAPSNPKARYFDIVKAASTTSFTDYKKFVLLLRNFVLSEVQDGLS